MTGVPPEQFIAWALPQLAKASVDTEVAVVALNGLEEFLNGGDSGALEKYAPPILRACQSLLEDDGTPMTLLRPLLGVLVVLGFRFSWCVQPHFADMVDLLLGWALESDVSEADCRVITDSFVQFQKLWVGSLSFSMNLLSKFLGDMEVLAQDTPPTTHQQMPRLLALGFCFVAVLQAITTGVLEQDKNQLLTVSLTEMLPRLTACLTTVGRKFGDFNFTVVACQCMTLVADFLKEKFAKSYSSALQVVFQRLTPEVDSGVSQDVGVVGWVTCSAGVALRFQQVHTLLQVNLQLLSAQGLGLPVSAVRELLAWDSMFSNLRLLSSRLVTGIVATTYMFLLQHGSGMVALEANKCLKEELDGLKRFLFQAAVEENDQSENNTVSRISEAEAVALFKFDLTALVGSACLKTAVAVKPHEEKRPSIPAEEQLTRAMDLKRYIVGCLVPFEDPLQWYPILQLAVVQALHRLCSVIISIKVSETYPIGKDSDLVGMDLLNECCVVIVPSLEPYASLPMILEVLNWISHLCEAVSSQRERSRTLEVRGTCSVQNNSGKAPQCTGLKNSFLCTLLSAASHNEPTVRGRVAVVLELLLHADMVSPAHLQAVATVALEQLGDPDVNLQSAYRNVLAAFAPGALWMRGWIGCDPNFLSQACWKRSYPGKGSVELLRPQQLVSILNYISQRWQNLPPSWMQRIVHNCPSNLRSGFAMIEEDERVVKTDSCPGDLKPEHVTDEGGDDCETLLKACSSNNLAAGWWAIHSGARHFVTVRLRTHLGGPTQTFAVLERMLVDSAQLFLTDSGPRESSNTISSSGVHLLPMRLLLEFMESLEKNIYNAYEGSVVLTNAPVASAPFFRANKKVCEEWFVRIRDALLNLSIAIQCHSGTFHHASLRLQDLTSVTASALRESARSQSADTQPSLRVKVQQDVYRVLRHASLALCRAHEVDALPGLQAWATASFGALLAEDSSLLQKAGGPLSWMTGLTFQAQGQYERAAVHYTGLLQSEEALGAMGADGVQFTIRRTIESYVALSDWEAMDSWLQDLQLLRAKHAGKAYSGALTTAGNDMNAIHALARFDAGDVSGAWGYLDLTPQSSNELTADPRQALQRSEQMLLQSMLRLGSKEDMTREVALAKAMLEGGLLVSGLDCLSDAAPFVIQLECIKVFEAASSLYGGQDEQTMAKLNLLSSASALPQVIGSPLDILQQDCHLWLKLFRVFRTVLPEAEVTIQLHQQLVRLARKQYNFKLARRLLLQISSEQAFKYGKTLERSMPRGFQYEGILLNYAEENHESAIVELWEFARGFMSLSHSSEQMNSENELKAKACLKLSSWLQVRSSQPTSADLLLRLSLDETARGHTFLAADGDLGGRNVERLANGKSTPFLQEIVGAGLKAASLLCPEMGKAWFLYASWCYDHAKGFLNGSSKLVRPVIFPQLLESELDSSGINLTAATLFKMVTDAINGQVISKSDEEKNGESRPAYDVKVSKDKMLGVDSLVQRLLFMLQNAAGAMGVEESNGESPAVLLSMQLHQELQMVSLFSNPYVVTTFANQLMGLWWDLRRKRVALFGHAARGFLHYLSMSNSMQPNLHSSRKCWSDRIKNKRADGVLSASLFVLQILLNYGVELEETLAHGLSSVSPAPWQALTAQLFARLSSHPEMKVRKQLEGLLMSLADVSPWAIVYPTLVDVNACEGQPPEELHRILSRLVNLHPRLVKDVQMMIAELGAITVLWDEQWLSTLQDLHADVMRRIATLKEEAARVAENPTLSSAEKSRINAAKYSAMMAPVAVALERRLASTSRAPETPHEVWFQDQFGTKLKTAIASFKSPPTGSTSLGDAWRVLDAIAVDFGNHQKKASTLLSEISPQLAAVRSSEAPMPGLEVQIGGGEGGVQDLPNDLRESTEGRGLSNIVTIAAIDEQVAILATKTKPKKISMLGSDGERYAYLLKGREDLRLDARIMQLLLAVNGMLRAHSTTRRRGLSVRIYSVTPISGRAGLIQWVNNLTSMYAVFKDWQQRVQAAQLASNAGVNPSNPPAVPRPSDLFYGKIIPALKEKGLRKVISRRDWPQEVKRKVLVELMKETPKQLLHRELWCASSGLHAFNAKQERFSGSVAVMSMVGYILGLGDRHLDNILVDFCTGDVVHIDYNVCFDKGLRLKIPEIVPFRLTQTIQAALGLTGVEGMFRANCEAVMKSLQSHKDLILMLLEVFIWDPLVEWMRGDGHDEATIGGEERKGMELAVSLSLFASRVQEIRVPLQEHHDQLLTTLSAVSQALQSWTQGQDKYELAKTVSRHREQNCLATSRNEAAARGLMSDSSAAMEKSRIAHEFQAREFGQVKEQLAEAALDMTQWVEHHGRVLNALYNGNASEIQAIGPLPSPLEGLSLTAAVLSAGVPLTIVPEPAQIFCRDVDSEVAQFVTARHEAMLHASHALKAYSTALQRLLPGSYIASSDGHMWAQILQVLVRKLQPDVLTAAKRQVLELVARGRGEHDHIVRQKYEALQLHVEQLWNKVHHLQAECTELEASIDVEAERKAKDRLLTIFSRHFSFKAKSKKEEEWISAAGNHNHISEEGRLRDTGSPLDTDEKRVKVILVFQAAVLALLTDISVSVGAITADTGYFVGGKEHGSESWVWCLPKLQGQIERWVLLSDLITDIRQLSSPHPDVLIQAAEWSRTCRSCVTGVEDLGHQMGGLVLPEALKAALSRDPAVLDAFTSLSRVRLSVDAALEQVAVIEAQRSSLTELKKSYPEKVEQISKRQAELEDSAARSREHLSWEEAEELASEEEACRGELEELHRAWAQRGSQASAIARSEMNVQQRFEAAEQRFDVLVSLDPDGDLHLMRGKVLLAAFARLFSGLEPLDRVLTSLGKETTELDKESVQQTEFLNSGYPGFKSVWKAFDGNYKKLFFVWKVRIMDTLLTSCIQDASSSEDLNGGLEQILNHHKKRLQLQLQDFLDHYLRERLGPVILNCLSKQMQVLRPSFSEGDDFALQMKKEDEAVKKVLRFTHEYCDAHETVRITNSSVSSIKSRVDDLMQALQKAHMEAAQMEWLHESALARTFPKKKLLGLPSSLSGEQNATNLAWWSRQQVLDSLQSSTSAITIASEGLQGCEVACLSAEEQLDRAMTWACAGPSSNSNVSNNSSRNSGIPPEFHEHLHRRRQLLWSGQEQAAGISRLCAVVLEFEASRDLLKSSFQKDASLSHSSKDSRGWQQTYQNLISRLESTYVSFTIFDLEWQEAQKKSEAAAAHLSKAVDELKMASQDLESATSDFQVTITELRENTIEAAAAVSGFGRVMRGHSALTVEGGTMIEEILAITDGAEGAHDVHRLAQEAFTEHKQLMADLSKINLALLPMEPMLVSAASTFSSRVSTGGEVEKDAELGGQGDSQVVFQSLLKNTKETVPVVMDIIPGLINYVKLLHLSLTKLARTASSDAGVLHKALEGVGESQEARSQEALTRESELVVERIASPEGQAHDFLEPDAEDVAADAAFQSNTLRFEDDQNGFISPSDSLVHLDAFHSDDKNSFQHPVEASQSLSTTSRASHGSESERNALDGNHLPTSNEVVEYEGQTAASVAEHSKTARNDTTGVVDKGYGVSTLAGTENHFVDTHPELNKYKENLEKLKSSKASTEMTNSNAASGSHLDPQHPRVSNYSKQEQTSRTKRGLRNTVAHNTNPDSHTRNVKERNVYAVSVLKRVKTKLEGRDINGSRQLAVADHVDHLLRQATSLDNLCNMYEGWTPWI